MINEALKFIADEVNKYLSLKLGATTDPWLVLGNVAKAQDSDQGGGNNPLANKAILSLVNIEEDRISKSPDNYYKVNNTILYKNPRVFLNLYCLFTVNRNDYENAMKWLSLIIQFFQHRNVFTPANSPALDDKFNELIMDLYSLNFEQINHLWGTLGGKYLPSVLYKLRLVGIEEETPDGGGGLILEVNINDGLMK